MTQKKRTKKDLMFQNRKATKRDRKIYMEEAYEILEHLLNVFEETHSQENGPEELLETVKRLVKKLEEARYFGFRSIGGDALHPPDFIEPKEFALIDHISLMYYFGTTIQKFLGHECDVRRYERHHTTVDKKLQKYIKEVEETDKQIIYQNLKNMKMRMELFDDFYEDNK